MKIGIIGAGNIGATIARKLAASGHDVKLADSREPETIHDLARDLGRHKSNGLRIRHSASEVVVVKWPLTSLARFRAFSVLFGRVP